LYATYGGTVQLNLLKEVDGCHSVLVGLPSVIEWNGDTAADLHRIMLGFLSAFLQSQRRNLEALIKDQKELQDTMRQLGEIRGQYPKRTPDPWGDIVHYPDPFDHSRYRVVRVAEFEGMMEQQTQAFYNDHYGTSKTLNHFLLSRERYHRTMIRRVEHVVCGIEAFLRRGGSPEGDR
jgi:hypothetical protein